MAIPDRVPIAYEPDYRTDTIGRYDGGLFFGSVTATLEDGAARNPDWHRFKRWYAVLHRFDDQGGHIDSQIWFAGTGEHRDDSVEKARSCLAGWLDALPGRVFGDISIKPFQVEVGGHVFGLVDQSEPHDGRDHAEFLPDGLGFAPPWDGLYDT
ncbi:hypothetical protein [Polymorphospora sp. NPDC050346]|uniref:hypothetical protein n=1 Tax=Polymorphospora sp. NPDC050346 TaxID=3155780 RepID=UPI0033C1A8BD